MIAGLNRGGMLAVDFRTKDGKDINMIHQENVMRPLLLTHSQP